VTTPQLLTVGAFARRSGLTPKALRHYDAIGLLVPAEVDTRTGYRRYAPEQLRRATLLRAMRDVGVPVARIRDLGDEIDDGALAALLRSHRVNVEASLVRAQRQLHELDHLMAEGVDHMHASTEDLAIDAQTQRALAARLFNEVWEMLEKSDRTPDDDLGMVHKAHASRWHWSQVGTPVNVVRGEWQCSRVYATLRRFEPALYHAQQALAICESAGIGDFDLAFCYEAMARAYAVGGMAGESREWRERAEQSAAAITEADDRELLLADVASIPVT
jgi:DNA-binding transcriptional MerR regulator